MIIIIQLKIYSVQKIIITIIQIIIIITLVEILIKIFTLIYHHKEAFLELKYTLNVMK